jgi:hypothetical protein
MAERREMAAVHFIRRDPQALVHDAPQKVGREEPILTAQQKSRRNVRPLR